MKWIALMVLIGCGGAVEVPLADCQDTCMGLKEQAFFNCPAGQPAEARCFSTMYHGLSGCLEACGEDGSVDDCRSKAWYEVSWCFEKGGSAECFGELEEAQCEATSGPPE